MKIIIADDYKPSRGKLEKMLSEDGHEVTTAKDGVEALMLYQDNDYDVAFIDWAMPGMDGIELVKEIKSFDKRIDHESYIVLVTSKSKKRDMVEGLEAGADDFVLKPYSEEVVKSRLAIANRVLSTRDSGSRKRVVEDIEPVRILQKEHELIRRMTGVLEVVSNMLGDGAQLPKRLLEWCASSVFLLNFRLHEKREVYYIDAFVKRAWDSHGKTSRLYSRSSLSQIMKEHDIIEKLLIDMQKKAASYDVDDRKSALKLNETIKKYLPLIRMHAAREDDVFFPFTQRYFTPSDVNMILMNFESLEESIGVDNINNRLETIEQLEIILNLRENNPTESLGSAAPRAPA
jgi:DNA-binding response OmpR family regulator